MTTVNIHEAKTHLSELLRRVMNGEEIIIAKAGKPIAIYLPYKNRPLPVFRVTTPTRLSCILTLMTRCRSLRDESAA